MPAQDVLYEKRQCIAIITLNRPERLNAMTSEMMNRLLPEAWEEVKRDRDIRVVIVTGAGEKSFCSGMDVKDAASGKIPIGQRPRESAAPAAVRITAHQNEVWKPVITAVNGICAGGGLMFLSDSDITLCSDNATFFNPGVSIGIAATFGPIVMTRWMSMPALLRMMLTGVHERISAQRAYELGMVTEVVPLPRLMPAALELAEKVQQNSPAAMRVVKQSLWQALEMPLSEALAHGGRLLQELTQHPDAQEGPRAFAEKRPPRWQPE